MAIGISQWRQGIISEQLDGGKGICADDVNDFATPAFGFVEKD